MVVRSWLSEICLSIYIFFKIHLWAYLVSSFHNNEVSPLCLYTSLEKHILIKKLGRAKMWLQKQGTDKTKYTHINEFSNSKKTNFEVKQLINKQQGLKQRGENRVHSNLQKCFLAILSPGRDTMIWPVVLRMEVPMSITIPIKWEAFKIDQTQKIIVKY